jgi:phage tail-like protein
VIAAAATAAAQVAALARRESELPTRAPLAGGLPALYLEPDPAVGGADVTFVARFTAALDAVLAPVLSALDNLPSYFDPATAPEHLLDWLAGWVGLELYERWPPELRRNLVARAVQLHNGRGTKRGVESTVAIFADVLPEQLANARPVPSLPPVVVSVEESGGVTSLARLEVDDGRELSTPPGDGIWMRVHVAIGEERSALAGEVDRLTVLVERVVNRVKPAHVLLQGVEVTA